MERDPGVSDTRWLNESEMAGWQAYLFGSHLLERRIEEQTKRDAGLTHAQYEILVWLSNATCQRMRMTELARNVVVSKSALTYQIGALEKNGLVSRESCANDERGVHAVLTPAGLRTLKDAAPGHVEVVRRHLIDQLSTAELNALTRIMTKVRGSLED